MKRLASLLAFSLLATNAHASTLRCGTGLVNEGDSTHEVQRICGEPLERHVEEPVLNHDKGKLRGNPVKVENWIYDRGNGSRAYLRFTNDSLSTIETRR
ncbi:DUF2845 domain-containing protein [Pseudomonas sp. LRF_L74]|uniref:DUF2845 domain-containing protein n=1 Tax=Pseudomonas sp. LRF_L74 TaxID=3369422 RepID=UPI003F62E9C2